MGSTVFDCGGRAGTTGMARALRVEHEGAWYHVMVQGNRREAIFLGEGDRTMMMGALGEACGKSGWEGRRANDGGRESRIVD